MELICRPWNKAKIVLYANNTHSFTLLEKCLFQITYVFSLLYTSIWFVRKKKSLHCNIELAKSSIFYHRRCHLWLMNILSYLPSIFPKIESKSFRFLKSAVFFILPYYQLNKKNLGYLFYGFYKFWCWWKPTPFLS